MTKDLHPPESGSDLAGLRREVTDLVAKNAIAMVQRAIDSVIEEGQYQAIKYLFEMVGLYPASAATETGAEESLAQTLLHHLGLADAGSRVESSPRRQTTALVDPLQ
jgi:hypothetical protein